MFPVPGSSAFAWLPTWMWLLPCPSFSLLCFCLSYSWFRWFVQVQCSASRATTWNQSSNIERCCLPLSPSEKPRPWNILYPGVLWAGSETATVYAILWSLLSDLSPHRGGDTHIANLIWRSLPGLCAKCFASVEKAWRAVESCENPSGSNLISIPEA